MQDHLLMIVQYLDQNIPSQVHLTSTQRYMIKVYSHNTQSMQTIDQVFQKHNQYSFALWPTIK